jgi:hypothetical protein
MLPATVLTAVMGAFAGKIIKRIESEESLII